MILLFDQTKVPRTTSRKEWKEIHQWCRVQQRELKNYEQAMVAMLKTDKLSPEMRQDMFDKLTNPPLLLGPYQ